MQGTALNATFYSPENLYEIGQSQFLLNFERVDSKIIYSMAKAVKFYFVIWIIYNKKLKCLSLARNVWPSLIIAHEFLGLPLVYSTKVLKFSSL